MSICDAGIMNRRGASIVGAVMAIAACQPGSSAHTDVASRDREGHAVSCAPERPRDCYEMALSLAVDSVDSIRKRHPPDTAGLIATQRTRAMALLDSACSARFAQGCTALVDLREAAGGTNAPTMAADVALYRDACSLGDGDACTNLGFAHQYKLLRLEKNDTVAQQFYERACYQLKNAPGCTRLSFMYSDGLGVRAATGKRADSATANKLMKSACEDQASSGDACLSVVYYSKDSLDKVLDAKRHKATKADTIMLRGIVVRLQAMCDLALMLACNNLGALLAKGGPGVPPDTAQALKKYSLACENLLGVACWNLGRIVLRRSGRLGDSLQAVGLYDRACRYGHSDGCVDSGYERERFLKQKTVVPFRNDTAAVFTYYVLACNMKNGLGCRNAGDIYHDFVLGQIYFSRSCSLGDPRGCLRQAALYEGSQTMRRQVDSLRKKACELDKPPSGLCIM